MKKSLLFLTLLSLISTSCNVVQMVTQGDTEVPDDFFQEYGRGPVDQYLLFSCGTELCLFDTEFETVTNLSSSAVLVTQESAIEYNGNLLYTVNQAVYEFDFSNQTYLPVAGATDLDSNIVSAQGDVYFSRWNGTDYELAKYDGTSVVESATADLYVDVNSLGVIRGGGPDRLVMCRNVGFHHLLHEINLGDLTSYSLITTSASSSGGIVNSIGCADSTNIVIKDDQIITANGNVVQHVFMNNDYIENTVSVPAGYASFSFENDALYFFDGVGPQYNIHRYDIRNKYTTTISRNSNGNARSVVESPDGKIFYIGRDGSGNDELWEFNLNDNSNNQRSNFAGSNGGIFHLGIGSKGLYLFTNTGGILKIEFGSTTPIQVNATNSESFSFQSLSKDRF